MRKRILCFILIFLIPTCSFFSSCGKRANVNNISDNSGLIEVLTPDKASSNLSTEIDNPSVAENTSSVNIADSTEVIFTVKVDSNYLALRNAPAYDVSNETAQLYNGDTVVRDDSVPQPDDDNFWYVRVISGAAKGQNGYVNKNYLMASNDIIADKAVSVISHSSSELIDNDFQSALEQDETNTDTDTDNNSIPDFESTAPSDSSDKKVIVIDAGHQQQANLDTEPIGPGSSEMKIKVSGGTSGASSGLAEYELTLALALKLQPILEERGYTVIQTRTTNEVDISNIERANVANSINADAFIRIHANDSDNPDTNGAMTLCQTPTNPYNGNLYEQSKALSTFVLDELVASTGCTKEYVLETDTMAGINWAQVPVTIVEVGYMSNPEEDLLMATDDYQAKICVGIANGIDKFFEEQ